jgi:hypothetical protein
MARTFTFTEARQNLKKILAHADLDGEVLIIHDGKIFVLRREISSRSSLDVPDVNTTNTGQGNIDSIGEVKAKDNRK